MKQDLSIWTTQLHKSTLEQIEGNNRLIFLCTNGSVFKRLFSLLSTICRIVFCRNRGKIFMPRVACFEFLFLRLMLKDRVTLTTDGLSDSLDVIEPKNKLVANPTLLSRPVDMDLSRFELKPKDSLSFDPECNSVVFYEKLPAESEILSFIEHNPGYDIMRKTKKDGSMEKRVKYIVTFPSTIVFEHTHILPKSHIIVIRSSELNMHEITARRHAKYEAYFEKLGYPLISLKTHTLD